MNHWKMKSVIRSAILVLALASVFAACSGSSDDPVTLENGMTADNVLIHLRKFQDIADENGGNRASGFDGYRASIDYIKNTLSGTGFMLTEQEFSFPLFWENTEPAFSMLEPAAQDYVLYEQFATMTYSGSGDVIGEIVFVDAEFPPGEEENTSSSGCEIEDFDGLDLEGRIAVIQRGTCEFAVKAMNAEAGGASAVIVFNEGQEGRTDTVFGTLGEPGMVSIPVIGITYDIGLDLYHETQAGNPVVLNVNVDAVNEESVSWNLFAESPWGDPRNVVMMGSHVDSVPEGPGINDPASGVSALMELILLMDQQKASGDFNPLNRLRIAFWGAEEYGLFGSYYYLDDITFFHPEGFRDIAMYLNFDMIASNNYIIGVNDSDQSDTEPGYETTAADSGAIESLFVNYFRENHSINPVPVQLSGASDYDGFVLAGVPTGGLFTGAGEIKTEAEAAAFGGIAGEPHDPYYHTPEDTVENLSLTALGLNAKAMAYAAQYYAEKETLGIFDGNRETGKFRNSGIRSACAGPFDKYHKDRRMRDVN